MYRYALYTLGVLAALIIGFCVVVGWQSGKYHIERQVVVNGPAKAIFPLLDDLKAWDDWSPWTKLDPNAQVTVSDPPRGKGATIHWSGNDKAGEGLMTIITSEQDRLLEMEQVWVRPMEGKAMISFKLEPEGTGTRVTMAMDGTHGFVGKVVCGLLMNMESVLGPDFDKSLANIKALAEKRP